MKNLLLILAIAISVNCMSQKKSKKPRIRNLSYEVSQEDRKVNLNYQEEISKVIDNWAYFTTSLQIIPWGEGHHHIVAGEETPRKVSAPNPFIPVKFWDSRTGGYIDTIEVESIKAVVTMGKELRFKTIRATDKNLSLKIPTITIEGREYIISSFESMQAVCKTHGIPSFFQAKDIPYEWMEEVLFIVPYIKGRTEVVVKNSCGNITIISEDQIYIYIPKSFVTKEDEWLKPAREQEDITRSNKRRARMISEEEEEFYGYEEDFQEEKRERVVSYSKESSSQSFEYSNVQSKEQSGYSYPKSKSYSVNCPDANNQWRDSRTGYIYTRICLKGDGLYAVSKRFRVQFSELLKMNPEIKSRPGHRINFGEDIRIK